MSFDTLLDRNAPASDEAIRNVLHYTTTRLNCGLPDDYLEFLRLTNGEGGPVGPEGFVIFWKAEELPGANDDYQPAEFMPGFFIIGSNGGNAAYGIDTRSGDPSAMECVETDFVLMGWDAVFWQGPSFSDLLRHIATGE